MSGAAVAGFGSDGVSGMVMAGQFPVRADRTGPLLPVPPVRRVRRDGAEGVDRPGQGMPRGVLTDPVFAGSGAAR
ncbi:MAG: hypothetical protein ABSA53_14175 [Streptosporangiaceae bacterium]